MELELLRMLGLDYLVLPEKRIFFGYLLLALVLGLVVGRFTGQAPRTWLGARVWWHPSARLDYRYFLVASMIKAALVLPLLLGADEVAAVVLRLLDSGFGYRPRLAPVDPGAILAYAIVLFLVNDLTRYWLHRLMHRLPWLWAIHRVHHSAEVLTPLTFYRVHPLENLLFGLRYAIAAGCVTGVFIYFFGTGLGVLEIAGVNAFVLVAHLLGDNLRHSHLHLRYPAWLEHLLISPAQHQFHHSYEGGRYNYGGILALWDWMFASLRCSRRGERYCFGIEGAIAPRSVGTLLFEPMRLVPVRVLPTLVLVSLGLCLVWLSPLQADDKLKIEIGRALFFDTRLSLERNQSCATCHNPEKAFSEDRDSGVGAAGSLGDDLKSIGDRNTPSLSYIGETPAFHFDAKKQRYRGGMFWDGRARDLADQAGQPVLNPIEMAMPDKAAVVERVRNSDYYREGLQSVYGDDVFEETERAYHAIAQSIAAFEKTSFFSPFDSKYDRYLRGDYELTDLEDLGMSIFFSTTNSNCTTCHQLKIMDDEGEPFSNYEYHNIGTPANLALRGVNGVDPATRDLGLGGVLSPPDGQHHGKFKVPGLRNIAVTGPYMHNGVFRELRTVIEFYDQYNNPERELNPETGQPWAAAEIEATVNLEDLKSKKLSDRKIDALIAFLRTLTDRRYEHLLESKADLDQ